MYGERVIGDTNLSIGTHLAMESIFFNKIKLYDETRVIPNKIDVTKYSLHMFNILTLLRNILNSYVYNDKIEILSKDPEVKSILLDEIFTLDHIYKMFDFKAIIYFPDYKVPIKSLNVNKEYPNNNQWTMYTLLSKYIEDLLRDEEIKQYVKVTDHILPKVDDRKPFILTTSYSLDYLNKGNYDLLESHTGVLKSRDKFGGKYHSIGKLDLDSLPMVEELYFVLGDSSLVRPLDLKTRRLVHQLSIDKKWTYRTTGEKVKYDIKSNKELSTILNGFKRVYF